MLRSRVGSLRLLAHSQLSHSSNTASNLRTTIYATSPISFPFILSHTVSPFSPWSNSFMPLWWGTWGVFRHTASDSRAVRGPVWHVNLPAWSPGLTAIEQSRWQTYAEWVEVGNQWSQLGRGEPLHIDWLPDGKRLFSTLTELHPLHYFILQALVEFGLANFEQLKDDDPHGKHSADLIRLIDEVILHAAVAIFLPSPQPRHRNPGVERYLAFSAFLHLCRAHYRRSELTLQHCDLDSAITCYRHLLCMREDPRARRTQLSADFARLVRWKYDLSDPIGGPEHVDVLLALYINCLPYRRLDNDLATVLETLVGFVHDIWRREIRSMYAQQVANHLRDVRQTCPSMYRPRMSIMLALMLKYSLPIDDTSHLETTESIRSLVQENFPLISPGDILRHLASHSLGDALAGSCTGSEGSTVSIDRLRVKVAQAMRPLRAHFLHRLAEKLLSHHDQFGDGKFLEESSRCMQELRQRPDDARYTMFGEIVIPSKIELGTTTGPFSCRIWLERMGSRIPDHQPSDHGLAVQRKNIEHLGAMAASTSARTLCTNSDQDLGLLIHSVLLLYSDGSPDDLDVCINVVRNFLDQPTSQRQYTLRNLLAVMCLQRFERLHQQEDLDECLSMFEAGSGGTDLNRAWKMGYLVIWAHVARRFNHPSTRLAYETYMRVMQRAVEWWPALQAQHATFRSGEALGAHALLDYASYQIEQGQLEAAVETIEQDKSLRRSTKRAQAIVSHDQEPLSDPKYLPTLASFNVLQTAASGGPVIIINHSQWRCDILIILPNRPPHRIPTSDGFYEHINMLSASLSSVRVDYGLDSQRYERTLRRVLRELYQLVGSPVMHALRRLGIPEQSRVWWCPTSALNTLPLHAMGPVPSIADDNCARYFSDIYVCSYTPALGALLDSRMSRDLTVDPQAPSLLPVDSSQMAVSELDALNFIPSMMAEGLVPGNATRATVIEGPRRHAGLEDGDLSGTSFRLNEGVERPTLPDVIRSQPLGVGPTSLSARHAPRFAGNKQRDEEVHLAGAMQPGESRSVVGTMWAMADEDGEDLSTHFYRHLSSLKRDASISLGERSAKALQHAVQKLRQRKGVSLERWVTFVHYGA